MIGCLNSKTFSEKRKKVFKRVMENMPNGSAFDIQNLATAKALAAQFYCNPQNHETLKGRNKYTLIISK